MRSMEPPLRITARLSRLFFKLWTVFATFYVLNGWLSGDSVQGDNPVSSALKSSCMCQEEINDAKPEGMPKPLLNWQAIAEEQAPVEVQAIADPIGPDGAISKDHLENIKREARKRYSERKASITEYCKKHINENTLLKKTNSKFNYWQKQMWFSSKYRFAWCPVPKAGSTTWTEHMSLLTGKRWQDIMEEMTQQGVPRVDHRNIFKSKNYGFPADKKIEALLRSDMFTWSFVRHPFARIVSAYSEKMDKDWVKTDNKAMKDIRDRILLRYRGMDENDPVFASAVPTPEEFSKYLLDEAKTLGLYYLDAHFKPLWASGPFCSLDFDVIGRIETFDEDTSYIIKALKLEDRLPLNLHLNKQPEKKSSSVGREKLFFSKLHKSTITKLYNLYKDDFIMFGYDGMARYLSFGIDD